MPPDPGEDPRRPLLDGRDRGAPRRAGADAPAEPPPGQRRAAVLVPLFVRDGGAARPPDAPHRDRRAPPRADLVSGGRRGGRTTRRLSNGAARDRGGARHRSRRRRACSARSRRSTTVTDFFVEPFVAAIPYPVRSAARRRPRSRRSSRCPWRPCSIPSSRDAPLPGRDGADALLPLREHVIWGATARMLKELLDALALKLRISA